jgi:5'(3')-deoxyribonucleotidase
MKIYVDYDSTLNDMIFKWFYYIKKIGKEPGFEFHHINEWDHEVVIRYMEFFKNQDVWDADTILPLPGSVKFLNNLNSKHEVYILSHTLDRHGAKRDHILRHYPFLINDQVILCQTKKSNYTKGALLIDDAVHNIKDHVETHNGVGILFNYLGLYKYNLDLDPLESVFKCETYQDVFETINQMNKNGLL